MAAPCDRGKRESLVTLYTRGSVSLSPFCGSHTPRAPAAADEHASERCDTSPGITAVTDMEDIGEWVQGFESLEDLVCDLGDRYQTGDGVAQSPAAAAALYRKAGDRGHAKSQWRLGVHYYEVSCAG